MKIKKVTTMKEPLEIDLQLVAAEIDTSVSKMKFISNTISENDEDSTVFERIWSEMKNLPEITSLDGNTILIECFDEAVILHENIENRYVIFDSMVTEKIEEMLSKDSVS